jgi:cyclic pyranopterin phosphate synthase
VNGAGLIDSERLLARARAVVRAVALDELDERLVDRLSRPLSDLRLSVTDRCNFRCGYCMPRSKVGLLATAPRDQLLTFEELTKVAAAFVELGVHKLRITGGEPLVRRELAKLVAMLSRLGAADLCMTTNGSLLATHARALASAGLHRVTVSLDSLDEKTFRTMTDGHTSVTTVLRGIDAARTAGLEPLKINMVVQRGVNEHCILPMAAWARRERLELRFIEYMDVGCSNGWRPNDVFTAAEICALIHRTWPIEPQPPESTGAPAERYRYTDGGGTFGTVASISRPFCGSCARARVSSKGVLYSCLFAPTGIELAQPLRSGVDLRRTIAGFWRARRDRYSESRAGGKVHGPRPEMSAIGG